MQSDPYLWLVIGGLLSVFISGRWDDRGGRLAGAAVSAALRACRAFLAGNRLLLQLASLTGL